MAETGERALTLAARGRFDAVLMDVNLPDISGIEVTRRLRQHSPALGRLPILGVSAHVQPEEVAACHAAGMDAVLAKPLDPDLLAETLARLCPTAGIPPAVRETLADLGPDHTRALLRLMLDRLRPEAEAIAAALRAGQSAEIERRAHQLKGAAGNFALPALVALLGDLSRPGARPAPDQAAPLLDASAAAERELARALAALERTPAVTTAAR